MRSTATLALMMATVPAAACAQQPSDGSSEGFAVNETYFAQLSERLDRRRQNLAKDFATDLVGTHHICMTGYMDGNSCGNGYRSVQGFEVAYSGCNSIDTAKGDERGLQLCEYLIERSSDKAKLACARVVGWFPGHHAAYKSSAVPMYFDAAGNWKLGRSPEQIAESARIDAEDRQAREAGKFVPLRMPPRYSNLHCTSDPNKFF